MDHISTEGSWSLLQTLPHTLVGHYVRFFLSLLYILCASRTFLYISIP